MDDITTSIEGTPLFLAPECCSFDIKQYSMKKADIWALGVTIYCLAYNKLPFDFGTNEVEIMEKICGMELKLEAEERITTPEFK